MSSAVDDAQFDLLLDGEWTRGAGPTIEVLDKYTLAPWATLAAADAAQAGRAVDTAQAAFRRGAPGGYERGAILDRAAALLDARRDEFVRAMRHEAGFTTADATGDLERTLQTLRLSAEEARRLCGDLLPFDGAPNQGHRFAYTLRVPLGVVVAITPFNSPLNTVAHKIAPAFAAGNATVLKPSSLTPVTACLLARVLLEAGLPRGFLALVYGGADVARHLLDDPRVAFYAFTGSTEVGRIIQQAAGLRRTQMELGSVAFTVLCADADLDLALPKLVNASYRKAGQVCTSVQVLLAHESRYEMACTALAERVAALTYGDPHDAATFVGPMIGEAEAIRVEGWIEEALAGGAARLAGGGRERAVLAPTLLTGVDPQMKLGCREAFGPVLTVAPFATLDEAFARVNATPYGLAAGIFTQRLDVAFAAARRLEVGSVHVNETSSARVDLMPYGGTKESGFGREGPHYTVREMTEERVVTIAHGSP